MKQAVRPHEARAAQNKIINMQAEGLFFKLPFSAYSLKYLPTKPNLAFGDTPVSKRHNLDFVL
jgi:hypothetical protein